jgi:nitrate reductase NapAB chaperone NapD
LEIGRFASEKRRWRKGFFNWRQGNGAVGGVKRTFDMEEAHLSRLASIVAVSGCVTFSLALLLYHHRNRKQLLLRSLGEKPQRKFKRVLADNSSLPFCHLHPQGENGKLLIILNIAKQQEILYLLGQVSKLNSGHSIPFFLCVFKRTDSKIGHGFPSWFLQRSIRCLLGLGFKAETTHQINRYTDGMPLGLMCLFCKL